MSLTEGEYRVGKSFNPSSNPLVDEIKAKAADLIDMMHRLAEARGPGGREAAVAMTAFEDGAMWAVKAVTKAPR